jgi:hypothetical protein
MANGIDASVDDVQAGSCDPVVDSVGRSTEREQLLSGYPAPLPSRKPGNRLVEIMLGRLTGIIAVNLPRVVHGGEVAGARVTRGPRVLRLSFGFVPRSVSGR